MRSKAASSKITSPLVKRLVERSGVDPANSSAEDIITALVERVRRKRARSRDAQLQHFLKDRRIASVEAVPNLGCDGFIEPIGMSFEAGFRMRLKKQTSRSRLRFTMAHEVCHTFFYELVPEMKFTLHDIDDEEERLCNYGGAVLLLPAPAVVSQAKQLPVCLESLETPAQRFLVSLPTMLLRLRALGLWKCQLSQWHRMLDGKFTLARMFGSIRTDWEWDDISLLERVWDSKEAAFGCTVLYRKDEAGARECRPISYELKRSADGIVALWGGGVKQPSRAYPLFRKPQISVGNRNHDPLPPLSDQLDLR